MSWSLTVQAILWTNAGILLIGPWGAGFSDVLFEIHIFSFKVHLKVASGEWRPSRLGLNILMQERYMSIHRLNDELYLFGEYWSLKQTKNYWDFIIFVCHTYSWHGNSIFRCIPITSVGNCYTKIFTPLKNALFYMWIYNCGYGCTWFESIQNLFPPERYCPITNAKF